jgi:hypothetical protein
MDHRLAIVIVPHDSEDPVGASKALLERFQKVPLDGVSDQFEPKFRYKRVGGWFDGLAHGQVGQERWSTILRMLLDGAHTNAACPFPGFGPETAREIESRVESDNTLELDDLWSSAPCTIIVTMSGEWVAHPHPDHLDDSTILTSNPRDKEEEVWRKAKLALLLHHRGSLAVVWDLSWDFIGPSVARQARRPRMPRAWGSRIAAPANRRSWSGPSSVRHSVAKQEDADEDAKALGRWTGEGGAPQRIREVDLSVLASAP